MWPIWCDFKYGIAKWGARCEMSVSCIMWPIWCDFKYGIAKWNSGVLLEVPCDMKCATVRNDGVMWIAVVWSGMSKMVFDVK